MRVAIPLFPQYASMAWCLVKHRDNFTFTIRLYAYILVWKLQERDIHHSLIYNAIHNSSELYDIVSKSFRTES
jgi:hypothetical protein